MNRKHANVGKRGKLRSLLAKTFKPVMHDEWIFQIRGPKNDRITNPRALRKFAAQDIRQLLHRFGFSSFRVRDVTNG